MGTVTIQCNSKEYFMTYLFEHVISVCYPPRPQTTVSENNGWHLTEAPISQGYFSRQLQFLIIFNNLFFIFISFRHFVFRPLGAFSCYSLRLHFKQQGLTSVMERTGFRVFIGKESTSAVFSLGTDGFPQLM